MPITGPKIQVPNEQVFLDKSGNVSPEWMSHFHSLQQTAFIVTRSGPTASRPTSDMDGRWIGMPYFDTTLGKTVYLKSVNIDVWVDGSGAVV